MAEDTAPETQWLKLQWHKIQWYKNTGGSRGEEETQGRHRGANKNKYSSIRYSGTKYSGIRYSGIRYSGIKYGCTNYSGINYSATNTVADQIRSWVIPLTPPVKSSRPETEGGGSRSASPRVHAAPRRHPKVSLGAGHERHPDVLRPGPRGILCVFATYRQISGVLEYVGLGVILYIYIYNIYIYIYNMCIISI